MKLLYAVAKALRCEPPCCGRPASDSVRKPDAGKLHVRFDERDLETERFALPRQISTLLKKRRPEPRMHSGFARAADIAWRLPSCNIRARRSPRDTLAALAERRVHMTCSGFGYPKSPRCRDRFWCGSIGRRPDAT